MGKFTGKERPAFLKDLIPDTDTHEYTHTHTHTPQPVVKERKNRRVQLLLKESTVNDLDAYAKQQDTSRNDIIQTLIENFLKDV